jgi:hypothetical protein
VVKLNYHLFFASVAEGGGSKHELLILQQVYFSTMLMTLK